MSVRIPTNYNHTLDILGDIPLTISGIPTTYTLNTNLSPITLNLGPIEVKPVDFSFRLKEIPPITLNLGPIKIEPIDFSFRLKEIPSVRVHLPMDYRVGLSFLGADILCLNLCGQGQIITEPYVANPCEATRTPQRTLDLERLPGYVLAQGNKA